MCGIFGICMYETKIDIKQLIDLILTGLRRLEYRGYDSAGFAFGENPIIIKTKGNVTDLALASNIDIEYNLLETTHICIAHTRWATHGVPSDTNAHPHTSDPENHFVVVHNGIIQNYEDLRKMLEAQGYHFTSHTDTEVLPILCKMYYDKGERDFLKIVRNIVSMVEGTYAILVKSKEFPDELIACKKESPLILGRQGNKWILSSDINALIEHTKQVCYLQDNDVLHITKNGMKIYNNDDEITRQFEESKLEANSVLKGNYDHYMIKEIYEQPTSILRTYKNRCIDNEFKLLELTDRFADRIKKSSRVLMIACGTSLNACIASRLILEKTLDIPVSYENACDFVERGGYIKAGDTCIFVSQSGETADTLQALRYVKSKFGFCIGITNAYGSTLSREANMCLYLNAGNEIGVGSTKAYTSQIVCLLLLACALKKPKCSLYNDLLNLPISVNDILHTNEIKLLAKTLCREKHILFIGRGVNYASALESSLKFKEIAYIHSEAILSGELKHGPLALIDDEILCIIFATYDDLFLKNQSTVNQLKSRKARLLVVCNNAEDFPDVPTLVVPRTNSYIQSILNIIPFQLLSYYIAIEKRINVDQPRNLAKSVTVAD